MDSETLYEKLMNASLNYVSYRPRSQKEVESYIAKMLKRWKVEDASVTEKIISRLIELGYLDDFAFASWWVSQRSAHKPKGLRALQFELSAKGVSPDVCGRAFTAFQNQDDGVSELDLARKAIQKKLVVLARLPIIEQKKKIYSFLASRGFGSESIGKIIDELTKKAYN